MGTARRAAVDRALGAPRVRRVIHAAAGTVAHRGTRPSWEPGGPGLGGLPMWVRRARSLWLRSLPDRTEDEALPTGDHVAVVVLVGPNDVAVAPLTIESARRMVLDPIDSVTIITTPALVETMRGLCPDATVVDEEHILTDADRAALERYTPEHRRTWYLQQIVKLRYCLDHSGPVTLVIDADTVMVRPQRFCTTRGDAFFVAAYHHPYFDHVARLLGGLRTPLIATTAHQMIYRREILEELVTAIGARHPGMDWATAILSHVDPLELSGMSEGEMYGMWMLEHHWRRARVYAWRNEPVSRAGTLPVTVDELAERHGDSLDSVSLHYHLDDDPGRDWRARGLVR